MMVKNIIKWAGLLTAALLALSSCTGAAPESAKAAAKQAIAEDMPEVLSVPAVTSTPSSTPAQNAAENAKETAEPAVQPSSTPSAANPTATAAQTAEPTRLPSERWKEWPVLSTTVSDELRQVYRQGLARGNNPHAFSILGDCQSQPEVFMGIYDSDPDFVKQLQQHLQETVKQFSGSFDRYSPTVKDGTTEGALLWAQWNDNKEKKCTPGETPIDCELRVHKPTIVFVHIGTHWEARNRGYLTTIIEKILEHGAVPVLVTKADNRELDERVNENLASLAEEFDLPLWNFWASVQHLPENGMEPGSDMYLSEEGLIIHRQGGLEALDSVWRQLSAEN